MTIPNLLSALRIASIPLLVFLAWKGEARLYLICFGIALSTDLLDGLIARLLNQRTDLGAKLDQWGDVGVFLSWPLALWWLWPEVLRSERWFLGTAVVSYAGSAGFALWKFGRVASYHSWLGKSATVVLTIGAIVVMLGWARWPFRVGILLLIGAIVEEVAISSSLNEPRSNVSSWWHARRMSASASQTTKF
ncbi:MAG: CDP-alcohol phosphatidyltransferase family protein [Verrucomicrobia bacterium]|nr:CDP-alcohol phosphatidyltransferase family protein [Verrucomicrobiota bacterium]